ncbi:Radical SAM, Pyruvate-formate lyase-activating enzyme like protein [Myxococcus hansupus]|uniref:Radical SAM, Pyruvate-formate lyase-activating enzyme like protein n=1 Tax=Pseudomyxococcus hansupus TaxID=1297742 RepID=A0A0H4WSV6_9BACT|nr:Radical SAM, Pyruvate-formate lyase-activating enzyme like protein [Myxococcus hansupus]
MLIPQHFGALLFDRRSSRYLPFDADAADVLGRLTERPAHDVIDEASEASRDAVEGLVRHLSQKGYLRMDGRLAAARIDRAAPPADHLLGPLAVHLEVIGACNLTCSHCFAGELPRNQSPLSVKEMDGLFAQLAALGSFRLGLTGGEPLMRKDLLDILDAATGHGLHPCITTNALLIDERWARELGQRELVWLNVSLEGGNAVTNDAVRGAGVFDRVVEKLALLGQHARFTLAFTLTRNNVAEVEACVELARKVGAHTAVFRPLYPVGTAVKHPELMPTFEGYVDALERLEHVEADSDLFAIDPFSPSAREALRGVVTQGPGCGAANTVASVSVQGNVNPCSFLGRAFEAGNIRARPFEDIWRDGQAFMRLRAQQAGDRFTGGCRARAQFFNGSAFAEDPWQAQAQAQRGPRR